MLDRKYVKVQEHVDRKLAAGVMNIEEGSVLCETMEGGEAKVTVVATPDGSERVAGIAILPYSLPSQAVQSESASVSAGATMFALRNNNLVPASVRVVKAGGSALTVSYDAFGTDPAQGTVKVDAASGRLKFNAADVGSYSIVYRHNLTVAQSRMKFHERSINNRDVVGNLQLVSVAKGYIEMATDQFDTTKDYSAGLDLHVGPNGLITTGGPGAVIPQAKVLALPDASGTAQGPFLRFSALIG